ncbi:hypothetical protein ABZ644_19610 [Nocardiopsis alba]|uniref:hypothetical protein n=1 Tax=Nocardiopsis alba TaxID=53437 RepID=UPI0033D7D1D4
MVDLAAAATAGATALATTIGTSLWKGVRPTLQQWLTRFGERRAQIALKHLDKSHTELSQTTDTPSSKDQEELRSSWRTRFEDFLHELDGTERDQFAQQLLDLAAEINAQSDGDNVSAGDHGITAGGNVTVKAEDGSFAAGTVTGGVNFNSPSRPGQGNSTQS